MTYSGRIQDKKVKNLRRFMQEEPKARKGFYVYLGEYHYDADAEIYFLPAWIIG